MRHLFPILLGAVVASAEPVQLRKAGNPTVVTFEYVTQDENTITVQLPGKDSLITYKWEDLDQDFVKKANPAVWAEREALAKPAEDKKMKKEEVVDPFAVVVVPTDGKSFLSGLQTALTAELKGLPIQNIQVVCKEFDIDETAFWKGYEDLKRISKNGGKPETGTKPIETPTTVTEKPDKPDPAPKTNKKTKTVNRSAENVAHEADAKKDYEGDVKPFNGLGYLRMLAEGGTKMKLSWVMLRRANEDRRAIIATLRKYESLAQEMADKTADKNVRGDALVLKKAVATLADGLEKVNRENMAVEARLQSDCQTLLNRLFR